MIQRLSQQYPKTIACFFFSIFYFSMVLPVYAGGGEQKNIIRGNMPANFKTNNKKNRVAGDNMDENQKKAININNTVIPNPSLLRSGKFIGGPSQPEMSSFKSAGVDNMVNLFTGDFSYNIPLLDVGGYPVNLFYNGSPTMEEEASWVGLGWNINPGNINRNMRGIPDDFNGEDTLVEQQQMKPNKTWGARIGGDFEFTGIKDLLQIPVNVDLGVSVNNYLGPALDLGIKGGVNINLGEKVIGEKNSGTDTLHFRLDGSIGADLNSREGLTISPSVSFTTKSFLQNQSVSTGLGLGTSYNSRVGIKNLQLSEQMSFSAYQGKEDANEKDPKYDPRNRPTVGQNVYSSTISFARPSYLPIMRMPLTNTAFSGHFQLGFGIVGAFTSLETEGYFQQSKIEPADETQYKPLVGYMYYQNAVDNPNAVMDFSRLNDKEVTSKTPIISAPQYAYDVFSVQGEGTGGTFRAYRDDVGYVRDNTTSSQDKSLTIGGDFGPPGHIGANFNTIKTPSVIGEWGNGNLLHSALRFSDNSALHQSVYFRNPGESSVLDSNQFNNIGGTDLVRYELGGTNSAPTVEPILQRFSKGGYSNGTVNILSANSLSKRKKRTQVISFLTAYEAQKIGLDKKIQSYKLQTLTDPEDHSYYRPELNGSNNNLVYDSIERVGGYRKGHHISQVNITEADGKRYVYGIPVYNVIQQDFTFSVLNTDPDADKIDIDGHSNWMTTKNEFINGGQGQPDGYVQITKTPAYAHSFLLTGLLSPDYVDVTGNGITEDDIGNAVKFNYTRINEDHNWRTPLSTSKEANLNTGNRSETKDDKGIVSFGKRESWYLHSIEAKTMIAFFTLEDRNDGKGALTDSGEINSSDKSLKCLKQIDLYNKADIKANGWANAKPIKTVHFDYSYTLCKGTPDNPGLQGKLTLDDIYFTFNGQDRHSKNQYKFSYASNRNYAFSGTDRWGIYKPASQNPGGLKNKDYPYSLQVNKWSYSGVKKDSIDQYASAWALNKILLPSGGQIEVTYESDDYAYVQNRRAADMMKIAGFGNDSNYNHVTNRLYDVPGINLGSTENNYAFVRVPKACYSASDVYQYYLQGLDQFAFRYAVIMPKGKEYLTCYANLDSSSHSYGVSTQDSNVIWIKLNPVDGFSPLALTALEYLREQLPGQAFKGYDVSESSGFKQIGDMLMGMLEGLKSAFTEPIKYFRSEGRAQLVDTSKSFVRLNDPEGYKYGGGNRVKSIILKDNWKAMTGQYTSTYGQTYDYTTTEVFNGTERTISSGVASYEPSIGGEENPFQNIVRVANKLPLGPVSYGSVEMPMLDAFFPAPSVGYSKVTVRAIQSTDTSGGRKSRSGIGKQVSEFYTAKDYPVYYDYTHFDPSTDRQEHENSTTNFFYKYAFDSRALSQGFLVATNDMHGKMKSQSSYAANDENTRISYTENFYRNTGAKGMDDKFDFVYGNKNGLIDKGNMGIDIELMTDTREFSVKTSSLEVQGQLELYPVIIPIWLPFIWPVGGNSENTYRAVTATKVINYHSILDSVVVMDKGSVVSTKNLLYDAETGAVITNRTNNEFNQPVYTTNYPAYWAYSGMGPAYKNIDAVYSGINFSQGRIISPSGFDLTVFESGDELLILDQHDPDDGCDAGFASANVNTIWAFDTSKNTSSLTNNTPHFVFLDSVGKPYTKYNVKFRIVRSGKRNMLDANVAGVTTMTSPVAVDPMDNLKQKLIITDEDKVINASAMEFKEKWQTDKDVFKTFSIITEPNTCPHEVEDCNGYLEKSINPYVKGLLGNFRPDRSLVFYADRKEKSPLTETNLPQNGFMDSFELYWDFNQISNLVPDLNNNKWVWNNQSTRFNDKGLELETKNALNIYTTAQYGYGKTLPVAITNNARYNEAAYDGFEDNNYNFSLHDANTNPSCSNKRFIDFAQMDTAHAHVANTDTLNFNAHTGKYVLELNANNTANKLTPVASDVVNNYSLKFNEDTTKHLVGPGGMINFVSADPGFIGNSNAQQYVENNTTFGLGGNANNSGGFSSTLTPNNTITDEGNNQNKFHHYFTFTASYYLNVEENGTFNFNLNGDGNAYSLTSADQTTIRLDLYDLDYNPVGYAYGTGNAVHTITPIYLCVGLYRVNVVITNEFNFTQPGDVASTSYVFQVSTNAADTAFRDLSTSNGCGYKIPIEGKDSMLNSIFTMQPTKIMLFSAWVRESCNSGVCPPLNYTNSEVKISFNGTDSTFHPIGSVIDGWQKIEGEFTIPEGTSSVALQFVNNSSNPIYFDDIRIQPFNANMKSYVYDPINLRLVAELDPNNYATFYEYDAEGTLIRTKAETQEGIKTINETRTAKQKVITNFQ